MAAPPPPPPATCSSNPSTSTSTGIGALAVAVLGGAGLPVVAALAASGALSPSVLLLELPRVARPVAAVVLASAVNAPSFAHRHVAAFLAAELASAAAALTTDRPLVKRGYLTDKYSAGEDPVGYALARWRDVPAHSPEIPSQSRDPVLRTLEALLREQPWDRLPASYWAGLSSVLGLDARLMSLFLGGEPVRTSSDAATARLTRAVRGRRVKFAAALRGIAELAAGAVCNSAALVVNFWMEGDNRGGTGAMDRRGTRSSRASRADEPCPVNYSAVVGILDDVELLRDVQATLCRKGLGLDLEAVAEFAARCSATRVLGYLTTEYHDTVARCADDLVAIAVFRGDAKLLPVFAGLPLQADRRALRLEAVTITPSYSSVTWDMRRTVFGGGPSSSCADVLMFVAACDGNTAGVAFLLERAETLPHSARWLDLPLFVAVDIGRRAVVAALLDAGADARVVWRQDRPLTTAAHSSDYDTMDILLAHGASLEDVGQDDRTPLEHAVIMDDQDLVVYLLEKGASMATRPGKLGLLYQAVERNYLAMAHLLVDNGADVCDADSDTARWAGTPLTMAIQNKNQQMIEYLLEKGGDASRVDQTLGAAAGEGDIATARKLLERGARPVVLHVVGDVSDANPFNTYFPIHAACRKNHPEMLTLLLDWVGRAIGSQARQSKDSQDAGGLASSDIAAAETTAVAAVEVAAAIAQRNEHGLTPLHEAACAGAAECVAALLAHGADVEAVFTSRTTDGIRPLHMAASAGAVEAVRLLVAAGAAVDSRDGEGRTPRMLAKEGRKAAVVALLVDDGLAETTAAAPTSPRLSSPRSPSPQSPNNGTKLRRLR